MRGRRDSRGARVGGRRGKGSVRNGRRAWRRLSSKRTRDGPLSADAPCNGLQPSSPREKVRSLQAPTSRAPRRAKLALLGFLHRSALWALAHSARCNAVARMPAEGRHEPRQQSRSEDDALSQCLRSRFAERSREGAIVCSKLCKTRGERTMRRRAWGSEIESIKKGERTEE